MSKHWFVKIIGVSLNSIKEILLWVYLIQLALTVFSLGTYAVGITVMPFLVMQEYFTNHNIYFIILAIISGVFAVNLWYFFIVEIKTEGKRG